MTKTQNTYSKLFNTALANVNAAYGKGFRSTIGPVLFEAVLASAVLDLLMQQDESVSAERVREIMQMAYTDLIDYANGDPS